MTNVPTSIPSDLPGCGTPAGTRVEIYSPRDGLAHGSLDAVLYLCTEHAGNAVTALDQTSLSAHRMPTTAGMHRCGDGYDFVARSPLRAPAAGLTAAVNPADMIEKGVASTDTPDAPIVAEAFAALHTFAAEHLLNQSTVTLLLSAWKRGHELSAEQRETIAARFPDGVGVDFDRIAEAFRVGREVERTMANDRAQAGSSTLVDQAWMDRRVADAGDSVERAYCNGYVDGLNDQLDAKGARP